MTSSPTAVTEALEKIKIRYPGEKDSVPLSALIEDNRLADLLKSQYPDVDKPGNVQFIPELRGETMTSSPTAVTEALEKIKIRYPGEKDSVLLSALIEDNRLADLLKLQYPDVDKPGNVQFIPELRGYDPANPARHFLKKDAHQQLVLDIHGSRISGAQHEVEVQDLFEKLRDSEVLKDRSLVLLQNLKKETIRHKKLQREWNNEFDLIVIDAHYGVFICEIKQRAYSNLKKGTGKKYNLEVELEKQEKRYSLLAQVRQFYDKQLPIHTMLICNSQNDEDESRLTENGFLQRNNQEYQLVVELNLQEDISSLWREILGQMNSVECSIIRKSIQGFTCLLYAIQTVDELLPSTLHMKFTSQFQDQNDGEKSGKQKGKKKKIIAKDNDGTQSMSILWSREQKEILDYVKVCFDQEAANSTKLRLSITGCMGSGKTFLLAKLAELFATKFPSCHEILFLVDSSGVSLLKDRLQSWQQLYNMNITFAHCSEYITRYSPKETLIQSAARYNLILIDEYLLLAGWELDVSNVNNSHIAVVTSYADTAERLGDFKNFKLSGSLRSSKDITEYVMKVQDNEGYRNALVPVSTVHNVSYRHVTTTPVTTGEQCVDACINCLTRLLDNDPNTSIMIISILHRSLLHRISKRLQHAKIPHYFTTDSITQGTAAATCSGNATYCAITLCNPWEAQGCESVAVIFVHDEDTYLLLASLAVSRATTLAFVYKMEGVYNDNIPVIPHTLSAHTAVHHIEMPCYEDVGQKSPKTFIQYLKGLVNTVMLCNNELCPEVADNKKILVTYTGNATSIIEDIKQLLPAELQHVVLFVCYGNNAFYSLNISTDFVLLLFCYTSDYYVYMHMRTTLPVKDIALVPDQEV